MKKAMRISILFVLCGLVMLTMPKGAGSVHASNQETPTIQVEHSSFMESQGTITVSATCPQNYHAQSGKVQINGPHTPTYAIQFNGPSAQGTAWTTTVENKLPTSLNVTVTAICAAT
jgi:hypothetical protein